jgi:8-oxo-dGTP pyrophosphatase MutT (NUDIX family)
MYYKVYNENGEYIRSVPVAVAKTGLGEDEYLKGVSCIVVQKGKILFEVRAKGQDGGSLMDFCSGHIDGDEDSVTAAMREMNEELGIPFEISRNVLKLLEYPVVVEKRKVQKNWIMTFFLLVIPADIVLTPQNNEVQNMQMLDIEDAFSEIKEGDKLQFPYDSNMELVLKKAHEYVNSHSLR